MYYDVIYVGSYNNFLQVKKIIPYAKFIERTYKNNIDYVKARNISSTEYYYLLFTHEIDLNFDFGRKYSKYDLPYRLKFKSIDSYDQELMFLIKRDDIYSQSKLMDISGYNTQLSDIFFISYDETYAKSRFNGLQKRLPNIQHIRGIKGINNAHIEAARRSSTDNFFVIDADAHVTNFDVFSFIPESHWKKYVHVWKSYNPVTKSSYGYGGVKLFPKYKVLNFSGSWTDFTGSVAGAFYKSHDTISNDTLYAIDEFSTWKAAFREMAKLTYALKYNPPSDINERMKMVQRIKSWCNSTDHIFSEANNKGAIAGRLHVINNPNEIDKINDYEWIQKYYEYSTH